MRIFLFFFFFFFFFYRDCIVIQRIKYIYFNDIQDAEYAGVCG